MAAPWIVDEGWWDLVAPLLPPWPIRSPGPRPVEDRRCRQPILCVRHTGIGGEDLPQELGFGAEMTCGRRLRRWTDAGIVNQLPRILLAELQAAGALDWSRAVADAAHLRAEKGGAGVGPSPVDRGRPGSKHHLICDGSDTPPKVLTTGGNVTDVSTACDLVDGIPPMASAPPPPGHAACRQGLTTVTQCAAHSPGAASSRSSPSAAPRACRG